MSKVVTTTVLPDVAGGSVTLGGTGDSVVVTGNDLRTNVLQDAGGNAIFTSNGSGTLSGMNSGLSSGALNLLSTQTASGAASVSFTSDIDDTYDVYIFKFYDINPATNAADLSFQASIDGGSNYNTTITSTFFYGYQFESDTAGLNYWTSGDQAQGTAYQKLVTSTANDADASCAGELFLFSPASTTYVKHFYSKMNSMFSGSGATGTENDFVGGYINTTSAVDAIQFKMDSGNFDGTIKMYGVG
jgi:hypothetical protein